MMLSKQMIRTMGRSGVRSTRSVVALREIHSTVPTKKQEEPLPPSLVERFQLTDPTRYVPLTVVGFSFGSLTGLYHFDAESQLLALWVLFCGTVYSKGSPIIADMLDDLKKQVASETHKLEHAEIDALKTALEAHRRQVSVYKDISDMFAGQNKLMGDVVAAANGKLKHEIRKEFVKKLDAIVQLEEKIADDTKRDLVNGAAASVRKTFSTAAGADLKTSALNAALETLSNPKGAKKDTTVSDLYVKYFKDFSAKVKEAQTKPVTLTAAQVKEVKEIVDAIARRDGMDASKAQVSEKVTLTGV